MTHQEVWEAETADLNSCRGWLQYVRDVEKALGMERNTLDGQEVPDGPCLYTAQQAYEQEISPAEYAAGWRPAA